jgi:hypothetical protein
LVILAPAKKVEDLRFGLGSLEIFAVKESTSNQVQDIPMSVHTSGLNVRQAHLCVEISVEV